MTQPVRQPTFGEYAVNKPHRVDIHPAANDIMNSAAAYIDTLNDLRNDTVSGEVKRQLSVAITEAQTSCKWAVDAILYQY